MLSSKIIKINLEVDLNKGKLYGLKNGYNIRPGRYIEMIRFGPSGIPLSCKGRTLLDGVSDVHKLGLTSMEVQFLRMNVRTSPVDIDEDAGLLSRDVEGKFITGVNRGDKCHDLYLEDLDKELEPGDMLHYLKGGVAEEFYRFSLIGQIAREIDVKLTLHTPYYMMFTEKEGELVERSKLGYKFGAVMAAELNADMVVTHVGLMEEGRTCDDVIDNVIANVREMRNWTNKHFGDGPLIGLETQMGDDVFGGLDDVIHVCNKVSGTQPVINLANVKARDEYELEEAKDFEEVFESCRKITNGEYYITYSGVESRRIGQHRMTPIKRGDLRFEPLAEHLISSEDNFTIISNSPLKEHDAMYMRVIFERNFTREVGKELRRKKKDE